MDIEFHYYVVYILARKAGFAKNDSYLIAYSSQYVDDNNYHYYINFEDGGHYINAVSQTMDITKPSAKRQKIYPLFHFLPGDPDRLTAKRKDGKQDPYVVEIEKKDGSTDNVRISPISLFDEANKFIGSISLIEKVD